jgi:hypothetical protein
LAALRANHYKDGKGLVRMKRLASILAVVAIVLAAAGPAYAVSPVGDTYGGRGNGVLGAVNSGGGNGGNGNAPAQVSAVRSTSGSGSLPFTGLDIGLLALGGCALVGVGVGLRRFARPLSN